MVESADSGLESTDSTADSATNPLRIGLWIRALSPLRFIGSPLELMCLVRPVSRKLYGLHIFHKAVSLVCVGN